MKSIFFFTLVIILTACSVSQNQEEEDSSKSEHLVAATNWFQNSAEMRACYYQAFYLAKLQLEINLQNHQGTKPTSVVLDIDETVLDNSPFQANIIKNNQSYNSALWKEWTDLGQAEPLPGALEFIEFAKSIGVEVFYVSNRKVNELASTIKNMSKLGFPNADTTHVLLRGDSRDKSERRSLVSEKFEIILFVGDNLTDFSQLYEERGADLGFKLVDEEKALFGQKYIILPNPMYGNWEGSIYGGDYSLSDSEKKNLRHSVLKGY